MGDKSWNVNIFSEHDVANVLKRFIRQLDEPLLTENLKDGFLHAVNIEQVKFSLINLWTDNKKNYLHRLMRNWTSTEICSINFL